MLISFSISNFLFNYNLLNKHTSGKAYIAQKTPPTRQTKRGHFRLRFSRRGTQIDRRLIRSVRPTAQGSGAPRPCPKSTSAGGEQQRGATRGQRGGGPHSFGLRGSQSSRVQDTPGAHLASTNGLHTSTVTPCAFFTLCCRML